MFTSLRPSSLRVRQVAGLRAADRRLLADHARLAQGIGLLIGSTARTGANGQSVVPNTRASREALSQATWERVLKPYYVGQGEPLRGNVPQSAYATLLVEGVTAAIRLQVDWHTAILRRHIRNERVLAWLTGPRPLPRVNETLQESFAQWLDPRGFKLADRIQRMAVEIKARMSRFFDYHIGRGTEAGQMAQKATDLLTTGEKGRTPYGPQASYPARLLLRNEMIVAGGNATQNLSRVSPIVEAIAWDLDPSHPRIDICDDYAHGGPNGDGVYSFELLPPYPAHPLCRCHLRPVAVARPAEITAGLLAGLDAPDEYTASLQGLFNANWLTEALKSGAFQPAAERVLRLAQQPAAKAAVERV